MQIQFYKYQGAGNDFIILDNRNNTYELTTAQINFLCDRKFGIGADGLMYINSHPTLNFQMVYFNSDGSESTMCGNGGRCIVKCAYDLGMLKETAEFIAIDGLHQASLITPEMVRLQMQNVMDIEQVDAKTFILNTGSPHYVSFEEEVKNIDVYQEGYNIRHLERFEPKGINVNFVQKNEQNLIVRTYERGVEDETLACGTGVTAAAIASTFGATGHFDINIEAMGGALNVSFDAISPTDIQNIWLTGPAKFVFSGTIEL